MTDTESFWSGPWPSASRVRAGLPFERGDGRWLALAALPAVVAVAVYIATNPYPAFGAGLYLQFGSEIAANGYAPPTDVEGYTAIGVPFAYPPLQFYVLAVLLDLGVDPLAIARFLPGVAVVAATVPAYLLGRDLSESRAGGALAATLLSLNPQVLQWHVSAGGVVRAFAFLYALVAIYAAYRAFTTDGWGAVAVSAVAFGATVLSHPTYTLFAALSILTCYATESRSLDGLVRGAAIALGGALVAAPWLAWTVTTHGIGRYVSAAGTHGGVGGGAALGGFASSLVVVPLATGAYLLARRRYFLPAWLVVAEVVFQQPRFAYAVGAFAMATTVVDLVRRDALARWRPADSTSARFADRFETPAAAGFAVVIVLGTAVGGAYLAHEMTLANDPSTPEFVDDDDVAAMEWAAEQTPQDATFVVLGDAAEWFPVLADRTIVVSPWGVEWVTPSSFEAQIDAYENVSACKTAWCVGVGASGVGVVPDYVVVPKGAYTIRGQPAVQFGVLERSFAASPGWERAYENDGVVVYRSVDVSESGNESARERRARSRSTSTVASDWRATGRQT
ncbi:glycosyltransferase family 39 protein [Halorubellus sp. JP-L1]|uniref:glycosyltransferase family 39 protein n=1 Tax=Halorubellus sp. JP-L1 TaxID=2715753 RepID=UPI00140DF191|nr:glycosyltransferase family 39 protein [Halorubellus sp. JP-L1]NHN43115.1 glycosyltransferase family 39 protein [Halorubellus sp. JP-L1]